MDDMTKMPGAEADKDVRWWHHQLDLGIAKRNEAAKRWKHNEDSENMERWFSDEGTDYIPLNLTGSWMQTMRATLAFNNPRPKLEPATAAGYIPIDVQVLDENDQPVTQPQVGPDGQPMMDMMGQPVMVPVTKPVLRYKAREALMGAIVGRPEFGLADTITRLLKAGGLAYGVLKVGSRPVFETEPEPDRESANIPIGPDGLDFSEFVENPQNPAIPMLDDDGNLIRKADLPVGDSFFIDWQHYRQMIHDPNGGNDFSKHRWVAVEVVRNLKEVQADPLYANTKDLVADGDIGPDGLPSLYDGVPADAEFDDRDGLIRLFEIFDMVHDRLIVIANGHGKFLRNEQTPEGITDSPFTFYRPNEILGLDGEWYPRPPVTNIAPIVDGINSVVRLAHVGAKKTLRKTLMPKGLLDPENEARFTNDEDSQVVYTDKTPYGINDSIVPYKGPEVPESLWRMLAMLEKQLQVVGGLSESSMGRMSGGTATETEKVASGEGIRMSFERAQLAQCLIQAFCKLNESIDANLTTEQAVKIIGDDGQAFVGRVERGQLGRSYDYDVKIDLQEMQQKNDAMQGAQKVQLMQAMSQAPWMFSTEILARGWCDGVNIKDENFIKALAEKANEMVQMEKMAAMQAMMPAQPKVPEAPPPQNEADAISQMAAGQQIPNMQGAT